MADIVLSRARTAALRTVAAGRQLRSTRRTVHRDLYEQWPPPRHEFARFGEGSWIVPPCEVHGASGVAIGDRVVILEHSSLRVIGAHDEQTPRLVIGDGVRLTRFVTIVCEYGIELEDDVASSDAVTIVDTWRDLETRAGAEHESRSAARSTGDGRSIHIEKGAYLGYGCTIGPGVRVGAGAFVGEGAVVTSDVPPHSLVYGNPAVVVRRHDDATGAWEGPRWP